MPKTTVVISIPIDPQQDILNLKCCKCYESKGGCKATDNV